MSGSRAGIGFAAAAMLAALPHLVFAGDAPLRVGVYHNPPKIQLAEGEPPTGFWPELTRVIAAAEGRSVEWVSGDWNTLLSELASSDIDVLVDVAVTEQRRERIVFGEETVHVSWSRVYAAPGVDIEVIPDLRGRRVGVLEVTGATGPGPGALAFATAPGSAPLWGGTVLIDLALLQLALPLVLDSAGYGTLGLPIPQNPNLLGKQIYVQAFALDPSAPYGLLLSNGLEIQACPQ